MKKLVNYSTVGQKLLITRRVKGKLIKSQIHLKPNESYVFQSPPDLLGDLYLNYYKSLEAIGIKFETDEDESKKVIQIDSKRTPVDPFEPVEFVKESSAKDEDSLPTEEVQELQNVKDPPVVEADIQVLIGYLESTYNKSALIEMATSMKLETWGTKAELAKRIANTNPQDVVELMSQN